VLAIISNLNLVAGKFLADRYTLLEILMIQGRLINYFTLLLERQLFQENKNRKRSSCRVQHGRATKCDELYTLHAKLQATGNLTVTVTVSSNKARFSGVRV
jgi:hypothetical protein